MIAWRIFYAGGATFSSADGEAWEAPADGVLAIVKRDPANGRFLLAMRDYYWFDGEWFGGDIFGLFDHLRQSRQSCVKFGRFVGHAEYERAILAATSDPDFPPKSASHPEERF